MPKISQNEPCRGLGDPVLQLFSIRQVRHKLLSMET